MVQLFSIVKLTIKEIIQGRIFSLSILLGVFLSLISFAASEISYGNKIKIYFDIGLGFLFFSTMILSMFFGSSVFSKEIEETFTLFAKPKKDLIILLEKFGYFFLFLVYIFIKLRFDNL